MNLTNAAKKIKQGMILFVIITIAYYILAYIVYPGIRRFVQRYLPERDPPNFMYGNLPKLYFENKAVNADKIDYELIKGVNGLPFDTPRKMRIYKFLPITFSFTAGKNAQEDAARLGFTDRDLTSDLKGFEYRWRSRETGGVLTINVNTKEMSLVTPINFIADQIFANRLNENMAKTGALNIFKNLNRIDDTYVKGTQEIVLGRIQGKTVLEAQPNEAVFAEINLYRLIDKYKVVGSDFEKSNLRVQLVKPNSPPTPYDYPNVFAHYWGLDLESQGTYAILFPDEAWNYVKSNKGIISSVRPKNRNYFDQEYVTPEVRKIIIKDVYLAYYETPQYQEYLQPIYVFNGNYSAPGTDGGEITVYYPAVRPEYIQE